MVMRICSPVVLSYLAAGFDPRCRRKDFLLTCRCLLLAAAAKMCCSSLDPKRWCKTSTGQTQLGNPYYLRGPQRFRAGDQISNGPQVGRVATQALPCGRPIASKWGRKGPQWPTKGPASCITSVAGGVPNATERRTKSEVAHKLAGWLHNPCYMGVPAFQSGGQNQQRPTSGPGGEITPAASGVINASEQGAEISSRPQVGRVAT